MAKEKRNYQRIKIRVPVQLTLSSGETITVTSANLSAGGVAVSSDAPADPGTQFQLSVPVAGAAGSRSINVAAKVVHHYLSSEPGRYIIGMAFVGMAEEDRVLLDHYVKSIDRMRS
ncbi:MAG: PilZ domain-containing protein [Gammaproteobacteria bacterium]